MSNATMRPQTLAYLRHQLRLTPGDLDIALHIPPGTVAAAEAGKATLTSEVILRLRNMVHIAETAGQLPERMHLGMLIRQARVAMGLTQTELANRIGIRQNTYSAMEGAANVSLTNLRRVAKALEIPADWILRGTVPLTDILNAGTIAPQSDSPSDLQPHQQQGGS